MDFSLLDYNTGEKLVQMNYNPLFLTLAHFTIFLIDHFS